MKTWRWLCLACVLSLAVTPAKADVMSRAQAYAERLEQEALIAVAEAQKGVRLSEETSQYASATEASVRESRDAAAMAVAREAVAEATQGVREARRLLERAKALLATRERQLREMKSLMERKDVQMRGVMFALDGRVTVFDAQSRPVRDPLRLLQPGDHVVTGKDGRARLILADGSVDVQLKPDSDLEITAYGADAGLEAYLAKGFGDFRKTVKSRLQKIEVRTPLAVTSVRGTEFFVQALHDGVRVGVYESSVIVTPSVPGAEPAELPAGKQREWTRSGGWGPLQELDPVSQRVGWGE